MSNGNYTFLSLGKGKHFVLKKYYIFGNIFALKDKSVKEGFMKMSFVCNLMNVHNMCMIKWQKKTKIQLMQVISFHQLHLTCGLGQVLVPGANSNHQHIQ